MDNELGFPEKMDSFFNLRTDGYDAHIENTIISEMTQIVYVNWKS